MNKLFTYLNNSRSSTNSVKRDSGNPQNLPKVRLDKFLVLFKQVKLRNIVNNSFPWFCSLIVTSYTYRSIFRGNLFGDPLDARLQMVLHEHWWRFLNGQASLRNVEFFYPFDKGLGFSDVFFVQGIFHSVFRLFDFSMETSWTITTMVLIIVGNAGWVIVAKNFINSKTLIYLLIISSNISLPFYFHFTLQANTVGYAYISWVIVLFSYMSKNIKIKKSKINNYLIYHIIIFLIFALSCWYFAFFIILTFMSFIFISLLNSRTRREVFAYIQFVKINFEARLWLIFSPIYLSLIFLFLYIYVPVQESPYRPTQVMLDGSPRLNDIFNSTRTDQAIFGEIYKLLNLDATVDRRLGLGIVLPILSILFIINLILNRKKSNFELRLLLAVITTYIYFLAITPDFSIHKLLFLNVFGFNSIRYPFRYTIFISYILILLLFIFLDKFIINKYKFIIAIFMSALLITDQYRIEWVGWKFDEIKNSDLLAFSDEVRNKCDYFYYDAPGGWWYDQIEAMMFAYQVGIPTVNGYSGGYPDKYPTKDFRDSSYSEEIFTWMRQIPESKQGCFLTGKTPIYFLSKETTRLDFVGFQEEDNSYLNATSPYPYFFIYSRNPEEYKLSFEIGKSQCQTSNSIFIKLDPETASKRIEIENDSQQVSFQVVVDGSRIRRLQFSTEQVACEENGKSTYFNLSNVSLERKYSK